jgi:hypothetical protein
MKAKADTKKGRHGEGENERLSRDVPVSRFPRVPASFVHRKGRESCLE